MSFGLKALQILVFSQLLSGSMVVVSGVEVPQIHSSMAATLVRENALKAFNMRASTYMTCGDLVQQSVKQSTPIVRIIGNGSCGSSISR
jgi:hypothetical protein